MKSNYKQFYIDAGTYDFGINFCITPDLQKAVKFINYKLKLPNSDRLAIKTTELDSLGMCICSNGYCPIVWLPAYPITPQQFGILFHEIFHAVCDCMQWAHIQLTQSSEEAYCHLISHITKKFFETQNK